MHVTCQEATFSPYVFKKIKRFEINMLGTVLKHGYIEKRRNLCKYDKNCYSMRPVFSIGTLWKLVKLLDLNHISTNKKEMAKLPSLFFLAYTLPQVLAEN